jgi:hypothetical protein
MTRRIPHGPREVLSKPDAPPSGSDLLMRADPMGGWDAAPRLCHAWRAWETGAVSALLEWVLSPLSGADSVPARPPWQEWVWFAKDSRELDALALEMLDARVEELRSDPTLRVVIRAVDIRPGPPSPAMGLALGRVLSIWDVLVAGGVDPHRIRIIARGARWSAVERSTRTPSRGDAGGECRFRVTDSGWDQARN